MNRHHYWLRSLLLLLAVLFGTSIVPLPQTAQSANTRKLLVDATDTALLAELRNSAARLLVDYGAFSLWETPNPSAAQLAQIQDDFDAIYLRGDMTISPHDTPPDVPPDLRQQRITGPHFQIVQFVGPILPAWLDELRTLGLTPVAYMPNHAYVVWGEARAFEHLAERVTSSDVLQWQTDYHPQYRLEPGLREIAEAGNRDVTVQYLAGQDQVARDLIALGAQELAAPYTVAGLTSLSLRIPANLVHEVAGWPAVFNVEPYAAPQLQDERQAQVVAGNLGTEGASGPGYLEWLAGYDLPTDPQRYPIVAVVDSGLDTGDVTPDHPVFYQFGDPANPSRVVDQANCTTEASGADGDGHGSINAGIVAGYDDGSTAGSQDAAGFAYGLGIAPFARLSSVKIFRANGRYDISRCSQSAEQVVVAAQESGALISSNSWGASSNNYTSLARAYDGWTRDANPASPGAQQMLHVFSAGNSGTFTFGVTTPSTAKNVVTVGATASLRPDIEADGCGATLSNSPLDIADFSSRGPTADKRFKPDLVAPGTHIVGPASQAANYNGSGVCGWVGADDNRYYPPGQTRYTISSGTSHSAPAVAGAAAIFEHLYRERWTNGSTASPAMLKALLLHQPRYLTAAGGNDRLPGWSQGWGALNLAALLDEAPDFLLDQTVRFDSSGQVHEVFGSVADPAQALVLTLTWSDAPGSTSGIAGVNNLDLEVRVGNQIYRGNGFDGAWSQPGGTFDDRNNVERIVVPAGAGGPVQIRVIAANIAGDAVPDAPGVTDQDFALVVSNMQDITAIEVTDAAWSEIAGNGDAFIDPGETIAVEVTLSNRGDRPITEYAGRLQGRSGRAVVLEGPVTLAEPGPANTQTYRYHVLVKGTHACGNALIFDHVLFSETTRITSAGIAFASGQAGEPLIVTSELTPIPIDDDNFFGTLVFLPVETDALIADVDVQVDIAHPWVGDLALELISPSDTSAILLLFPGDGTERGDNLTATIFDDEGGDGPITAATPPYSGRYRPVEALSRFDGERSYGLWALILYDDRPGDIGQLLNWSLAIETSTRICTYDAARTYLPFVQTP
jgi:subtilisin-like proprotein convertase family protein